MLKQLHIFIFICNFLSIKALRRIVGGRDVELGDFPYVGRWTRLVIYNEKEFWQQHCTCSFLSSSWAISAGHCLFDEALDTSIIMYGNVVHDQSPNYTKIIQTFGHPAHEIFNELLTRFDIALIKTHPVDLTVYGTLSAVDYTSLVGHEVFLLGYGNTNGTDTVHDAINVNKTLQVFKGMISRCDLLRSLPFSLICVASSCKYVSIICGGDSGGPVIHASGIVGVNSMGMVVCATYRNYKQIHKHILAKRSSSIVQAVSPVVDWVSRTIASNA